MLRCRRQALPGRQDLRPARLVILVLMVDKKIRSASLTKLLADTPSGEKYFSQACDVVHAYPVEK